MQKNISIQQIAGDDPALYPLVGPLVMDAKVLKANNNYPFKTSHKFLWFIALDAEQKVRGFLPMELRASRTQVNNYYVENDDEEILMALLRALSLETPLDAMVLVRHVETFRKAKFKETSVLKNYVKMTRTAKQNKKKVTKTHEE